MTMRSNNSSSKVTCTGKNVCELSGGDTVRNGNLERANKRHIRVDRRSGAEMDGNDVPEDTVTGEARERINRQP